MSDIPDTEYAVKKWLQSHPLMSALAGRVFFAVPDGSPAFPLLTLSQVSGITDLGPAVDAPRLTLECWGQNKSSASDLKRNLITALRGAENIALDPTTWCYGVENIFSVWLPDNDARLARYVVEATFRVKLTAAA